MTMLADMATPAPTQSARPLDCILVNNSQTRAIEPVRPAAGYIGGKRNLAGRLVPIIDRTPHDSYAEPFVGMGGIFLRRRRQPKAEFINDISGDVVTFFRVLQRHYQAFMDELCGRATGVCGATTPGSSS